ncbi:MAG: PQQ-binding-like beta-propeller repeat protein [Pirellulales bacterium]|nr:PQQ-binding-like beta-propeller repeat protein [Pirellulales bacterium]
MKSLTFLVGCITLAGALSTCGALVSAENEPYWPRFHGPKEDNISTDTGLLRQWPDDGPPLAWTAEGMGIGFAGVTLAHGLVYTAGNVDGEMKISALDLNGRVRWQAANGKACDVQYEGSRGTPTIDGDRLYHESPTGQLGCFDARTGKPIWTLNILDEFKGKLPRWALAESVLIDGDRVICCPGGPETAVVALDKMTGQTVWKSPSADGDPIGYASPAVIEYNGLRMILTMTNQALIGVNADNGDLLFRFAHPTRWEVTALMPVFHDGHIFISSGYGTSGSVLLKLNVDGQKADVEEVWRSKDLDNHHGGVVLLDGYVYGAGHQSGKGKWVCLDWTTGKTMWAEKGIGKGSLTCADGLLFTMNERRKVGLVRATPDKYDLISEFMLPNKGKKATWAHPVVCGGRLYLRHGDFLFAYDVAR